MKRTFNYTAALATTAAVGLLAGTAFAQTPEVCSTTQISPAHQDCVMPTSQAPGGGSFPGSFLVPGTNTSFAVHGFIQFDLTHAMGPHVAENSFGANGVPLEGSGVSSTVAHSTNGGTNMGIKPTRPNIETHTPTAYGLLKTYVEFDFNQTAGTQLAGNNDILRLRQAYGTLGPWLIGQTLSLYADPQAYADTANGAQDVGMMNTFNVRRPQIRYTWLAGNGLSIGASAEVPSYPGDVVATLGSAAGSATTVALNGTTTYYNWPHFVVAPEWDQPWGHVKLALAGGMAEARNQGATTTTPNLSYGEWAVHLSGHLNTWGKDALRGGIWYNHGAADFDSWISQGGLIETVGTGANKTVTAWAGYANYEHFFNTQWRANESFGYMRVNGILTGWSAAALTGLQHVEFSNNVNVIYSPVPQTDFILEWQHAYRQVMSGATGVEDQLDFQSKFYF
jgi:Porin subfamily